MRTEFQPGFQGRSGGFTLLEILIVIGIFGVLGALGIPQFTAYQRSIALKDAANQIAQALQRASSQAVETSAAHTVSFTLNAVGTDLTVTGNSQTSTVSLERDAVLKSVKLGATNVTSVVFDVRGRPDNAAPLVITTGLSDLSRTVRLLPTGKTVIQ
jgi:prepilin-type N-terminal cleavage/methylation domain-containing protein